MKEKKDSMILTPSYSKKAFEILVDQAVRACFRMKSYEKARDCPHYSVILEMISTFEPQDLIELSLACQYVVMHFQSYKNCDWDDHNVSVASMAFSHKVLETLMRLRAVKGRLTLGN